MKRDGDNNSWCRHCGNNDNGLQVRRGFDSKTWDPEVLITNEPKDMLIEDVGT